MEDKFFLCDKFLLCVNFISCEFKAFLVFISFVTSEDDDVLNQFLCERKKI